MKLLNLLLFSTSIGLLSCGKENQIEPVDTVTAVKAAWNTIDLNIDYTIQFPADSYDGRGYQLRSTTATIFGGQNTFINRKDQRASLSATFCHPSAYPCSLIQYGESLTMPLPNSVPYRNSKGEDAFLTNRMTFGKGRELFAAFYYGINPDVTFRPYEGRLYIVSRETGIPRYAGSATFGESTRQEIIDIISTIAPRY